MLRPWKQDARDRGWPPFSSSAAHRGRSTSTVAHSRTPKADRPEVGAFLADAYRVHDNFSYAVFLSCILDPNGVFNWNVSDRLKDIRQPVLVIAGQEDQTIPLGAIRSLAQGMRAEFKVVDDVGHYYQLERPSDFNADLHAFL
jgi:pimeloyl-ACP methyl ester carboxylesterase